MMAIFLGIKRENGWMQAGLCTHTAFLTRRCFERLRKKADPRLSDFPFCFEAAEE